MKRRLAIRWLTALACLLALPFLTWIPAALIRLVIDVNPNPKGVFNTLLLCLYAPVFLASLLLSHTARYLLFSIAALVLALAALGLLVTRERRQLWRRGRFYVLLVALAGVLAFPFVMRYQPAVEAAPGVKLRIVEKPGLLEGVVKQCQIEGDIQGECQYEPLGWTDAQTLVYRKWCGGYYTERGWQPGTPQPPQAYHLDTNGVSPFDGDLDALSDETCVPGVCVSPALAEKKDFPPLHYLPGHFEDPVISPNNRWIVFTARHVYGPEDLLIIAGN